MDFHYKPKEQTTKQPQPQSVGVFLLSLHRLTDSGKIDRTNGFDVVGYGYTAQHENPHHNRRKTATNGILILCYPFFLTTTHDHHT
jgi:hypothetical protein